MKKLILSLCLLLTVSACQFPNVSLSPETPVIPTQILEPTTTPTSTSNPVRIASTTVKVTAQPTITSTPTPTVTITVTPSTTPRPSIYTVREGDTLDDIADRFDLPTNYLASKNNIPNPNTIYIGQVLQIPAEYIPETTTPVEILPGKMILVVLSEQRTYAYEDGQLIASFLISSGLAEHPTVTGDYLTYIKLESTTMSGDGYYLENVPWVMYFYQGYSFHGTYWHHNFGTPMSHGCLNMYTPDAEWLYHWAPVGTLVRIIP